MLSAVLSAMIVCSFFPTGQSPAPEQARVPDRPNIVVLMLDDYPSMDNRVLERLPTFKRLFVDQGISFENFWANYSLCCPGRASFLTGHEAHHHGVSRNKGKLFRPEVTIATELQDVGYHTQICGKYFNATSELDDKTPPGWDDVVIKDEGPYFDYPMWVNGRREYHAHRTDDYSTDVVASHCMRLLRRAPADKPLFAFLTPNATHGGWDETKTKTGKFPVAAPRHRDDPRCAAIPPWRPASYNEADVSDKPSYIRKMPLLRMTRGYPLRPACESLLSVDEWLGAIVSELKMTDRYANTVFVLTADNGMGWGAHRWIGKVTPHTAQMPLHISWPRVLDSTPTTESSLVSNVDLAPTLCELAGCEMGPFANGFPVDGRSFTGLLAPARYWSVPDRRAIVLEGAGAKTPVYRGIMTSRDHALRQWLFVRYPGTGETELYDMSGGPCVNWTETMPGDPCMLHNQAANREFAVIKRQLERELRRIW